MKRIAAILAGLLLSWSADASDIQVDTPKRQYFLEGCAVNGMRVQNFGAISLVDVWCSAMVFRPQSPGWSPSSHAAGEIPRFSRLDAGALGIFRDCHMVEMGEFNGDGWQLWECLAPPE